VITEFFALLGLMLLAAMIYFVYDSLRAKELASFHGRRYCQARQLQFLDETVAQQKLGFRRNQQGRLSLIRYYGFEFSSDGSRRFRGKIEVRGPWAGNIELEPYTDTRYDASIDVVNVGGAKYLDATHIASSLIARRAIVSDEQQNSASKKDSSSDKDADSK